MDAADDRPAADALALGEVAGRVLEAIEATAAERAAVWTDLAFDQLAVSVFRAQYSAVEPYREWCDHELAARGIAPEQVVRWYQVPALPIAAFKQRRIAAHAEARDVRVWHSSGTTSTQTSRVPLPDLALYEASLRAGARAALLANPATRPPIAVQLTPTAADAPHSSLSHMLDIVRCGLCTDGGVFAGADGRVNAAAAHEALTALAARGEAVLVLATSFALVNLFDQWDAAGAEPVALPPGSTLMDTGGYKGRTREVSRDELLALAAARLGVDATLCENEYGMCELASQAWLGTIAAARGHALPGWGGAGVRRWQPPWMRTRVVDPVTLEPVAEGETGLLVHHDLANAWTCAVIRTEDIGVRVPGGGWRLTGRAPGAQLRGCSLQLEDVW